MRKHLFLALVALAVTFTACNSGSSKSSNEEGTPTDTVAVQVSVETTDNALLAVGGSCDMCTERILTTTKGIEGVSDASYDLEKQELNVNFNADQTNADAISKALANVGHDTELYKAEQAVYDALPACCKYRK